MTCRVPHMTPSLSKKRAPVTHVWANFDNRAQDPAIPVIRTQSRIAAWLARLIPQNRGINYPRNIKSIENKGVSCILALGK